MPVAFLNERNDTVVAEHELTLYLNGQKFISLLCTPRSLRELVTGFLHAEGIVRSASDILHLHIDDGGCQAHVRLQDMSSDLNVRASHGHHTPGGQGGKTLGADTPGRECFFRLRCRCAGPATHLSPYGDIWRPVGPVSTDRRGP